MTDQNQQASEAVELLPCPRCGSPAKFEDGGFNHIRVTCTNYEGCVALTRIHKSDPEHKQKLAAQWNIRALTPEAVERIAGEWAVKDYDSNASLEAGFRAALTQALQSRDAENARLNERVRELEAELERAWIANGDTREESERVKDERDRLSAELARVKKDSERLDWLLKYITQHGCDGLKENIPWTCYDEDGESLMNRKTVSEEEVADCRFDRPAIDRAIAEAEGEEK